MRNLFRKKAPCDLLANTNPDPPQVQTEETQEQSGTGIDTSERPSRDDSEQEERLQEEDNEVEQEKNLKPTDSGKTNSDVAASQNLILTDNRNTNSKVTENKRGASLSGSSITPLKLTMNEPPEETRKVRKMKSIGEKWSEKIRKNADTRGQSLEVQNRQLRKDLGQVNSALKFISRKLDESRKKENEATANLQCANTIIAEQHTQIRNLEYQKQNIEQMLDDAVSVGKQLKGLARVLLAAHYMHSPALQEEELAQFDSDFAGELDDSPAEEDEQEDI